MATTLQEMIEMTKPVPLTLPGFQDEGEITVLVKKPGFYTLLSKNAIPNPLLPEVEKLFVRRRIADGINRPSEDFGKALVYIARECLVSPTYQEMEEAGVCLTDDQLLEICMFALLGAEKLKTFRENARAGAYKHGKDLPAAAEPASSPDRPTDGVVRG